MNSGAPIKYREDPQKCCRLITSLIEKVDDKWQAVWKTAILELFESPEFNINSINSLLKVIEKAFKERTYHLRAQAFHCWQFFIEQVEKQSACEKLLNVILIPLSASNHSMKIVLDAKLKAWLTLLNTTSLCKSLSREKGVPSLLKILYGPHTLRTASSYNDLLETCGTIYRLVVQKCIKNDENNVILSYLEKVVPPLSSNKDARYLGKEIWTDVIEVISEKKWPMVQFNYLLKTLENLLATNVESDKIFVCELLSVLICEYNSFPLDHLLPQLSLLTRCLLYSASSALNLPTILEYLIKKFKRKEHILFDEMNKTLTEFSEDYKEQLQKCWAAIVWCFCKWSKHETDSCDNYCWILLFPVKYLHERWNSIIQEDTQKCFETMYISFKVDTLTKIVSRKLKTFLNNSENVPVSLLNAATCLCKIVLQKSKRSDDVSAIKDPLITIHEKLPSQTTVDGAHNALISKYLSCVLYFMERYPDYDSEFKPIICKYSECIDIDRDSKEYPVVQLISKYTNNKPKEEERLNNVLNKIVVYEKDSVTPNKPINRSFLARLSPAENKLHSDSPFTVRSVGSSHLQNGTTPRAQKSIIKDDNLEFVPIKPMAKNSPMTEHQKEMAKEKSYIPALYEDLSQSQSHSDSQSTLPATEKTSDVQIASVDIIEENAILPCSDTNMDSADEIPASLNFRDAIRSSKSSSMFASKKSLFNDATPNTSQVNSNTLPENTDELDSSRTKIIAPKRKSVRIESKVTDTTTAKRSRYSERVPESTDETSQSELQSTALPPPQSADKNPTRNTNLSKSASMAEERLPEKESALQTVACSTTEMESRNSNASKTASVSNATTSLMTVKNATEDKSTRRKSLKSKNTNATPSRSPINTRKRKSLNADAATNSKKPTTFDIDESYSETSEINIKIEKTTENSDKAKTFNEQSPCSSSTVTLADAANLNVNSSELTDSVVIVEDDKGEDIITIESQSPVVEAKSQEVIPCSNGVSEVAALEESTFLESSQIERDLAKNPEEHDQSSNDSAKSTQTSFHLALTESESERTSDDEIHVEQRKIDPEIEESTVAVAQEANETLSQVDDQTETIINGIVSEVTEGTADVEKLNDDKVHDANIADAAASEEPNPSASPLSGNSRTLQMLQMVYSGTPNLSRPKTRFKSNTRSPSVSTSPAANRTAANGVGARPAVSSRNMKMLQVNGHAESPVKPSPNKLIGIPEKKFKYTPKECTSPSILKKPNLNMTMSPKSPKSVNFAERLTDTREYHVDENNYTDSFSSIGTQGSDNLLSDEEATSQETLYPSLHNCSDDIKNIAERLTLNKQQLDTLRRMGIDTVGQLASANTIVGKSIPVGDNRIQRLRNALKAYDNDRKLKGLRAPSVRRKITYKSPVEVSSIIEILDDEPACEPEPETVIEKTELIEEEKQPSEETPVQKVSPPVIRLPTVALRKLPASEIAHCENGLLSEPSTSSVEEPRECSPIRMTRSQTSPMKNEVITCPSSPKSSKDLPEPCSPVRFTRSLLTSPTKSATETASTSPKKVASRTMSPAKVSSSPVKLDRNLRSSPCKNLSIAWPSVPDLHDLASSPPVSPTKKKNASSESLPVEVVEVVAATPVVEITEPETSVEQHDHLEDVIIEVENETKVTEDQDDVQVEFPEPSQDDELDFICTNNEETAFTNDNPRTYSKLMKARASMALLRTPMYNAANIASPSPVISNVVDTGTSISSPVDDSSQEERDQESLNATIMDSSEEQQSISIFSSDITKNVEDVDTVNTESGSAVSEIIVIEEEASTSPSRSCSKMILSVDEGPQVPEGVECVFYALLQRLLAPYVGPSCLSKWSNESASREEVYKLIKSLDEGMEWIQSAGLMDVETKNFLNQLKYFKTTD